MSPLHYRNRASAQEAMAAGTSPTFHLVPSFTLAPFISPPSDAQTSSNGEVQPVAKSAHSRARSQSRHIKMADSDDSVMWLSEPAGRSKMNPIQTVEGKEKLDYLCSLRPGSPEARAMVSSWKDGDAWFDHMPSEGVNIIIEACKFHWVKKLSMFASLKHIVL
ncbi:hypothetical protein DL93DRAFT_575626 [Clavulina sp. PMI_390]|nr:hypothetical protein DL93DRAFT_575626 [Clavulina sp. PMI_390]